ncbi:C40 family peptidase [Collinsella sp. zg1085]|uniref:C40 family peptidase n=1 Tax=Collinsella sp. zg1085 TaxID=2844380 RepID=UPI001C0E5105|nr:C40 family peptidase [Collinsella sp. zg1085]QWT18162.1 C40 family peptidase [Collinsella sp. zg1085]
MKRTTQCRRVVPVAVLAGLMAFVSPIAPVAYAETASSSQLSSQLAEAQKKLDTLSRNLEIAAAQAEETEYQLSETTDQIEALKAEIAAKEAKAEQAQGSVADIMRGQYKDGATTLIDILFSSRDFSELTSRLFYANRTAEANNNKINEVNELVSALNTQRDELSKKEQELKDLHEEQLKTAKALEASQREAESYVNGLSSELQAALAAEREAKAAEQRARAEAAAQAAAQQANTASQTAAPAQGTALAPGNNASPAAQSNTSASNAATGSNSSTSSSGGSSSATSLDGGTASTIISAAKAQLGLPYSYGASNPGVSFDCSGLTKYAYAQAGISIPHSSRAQYQRVVAAGNLKTSTSSLSAGDLVFYQQGGTIYHVAIYIGGGQVVHANGYGQGVVITGVTFDGGFCGGGSPI